MNIGELFIELGIKVNDKQLDAFNKKLKDNNIITGKTTKANIAQDKSLGDLSLGFLAVTKAIEIARSAYEKYIDKAVMSASALQNFNAQTGLSTQKLQQWQRVASLANINMSLEDVLSQVQSLQDNLTDIRLGGGDVSGFQLLGIDVMGRNTYQVLEDIRKSIKGIDDATATNLISRMGLNKDFIRVLRLTDEEFNNFAQATYLSQERLNKLEEFGRFWKRIGQDLTLLKDRILSSLATAFFKTGDGISFVWDKLEGFQTQIKLFFTFLSMALFPVTSLVTGLILAIDDLVGYFSGEDSIIGKMTDKVKGFFKKDEKMNTPLTPFTQSQTMRNILFNNTYNIQSTDDPSIVADIINSKQQTQFNYSYADFNNGGNI